MSNACASILVGVVSPLSEILLLSKTAKFPFPTMDYSPWSSKNLINWNQLKKFMQVGVDVRCMHTDFGGCGLTSFGDIATFNFGQNLPFGLWTTIYIVHGFHKLVSTQKIYTSIRRCCIRMSTFQAQVEQCGWLINSYC